MKDPKDLDPKAPVKPEVDETIRPFHLEGHKPRTRREFLAQGFLGASAIAFAPSVFDMLIGRAHGASSGCTAAVFNSLTPVIIIDLAGGGNLAGSNVVVGGQGGQMDFLSSYQTLGLPTGMTPRELTPNTEMGLAFHSDSGILRGIQSATSAATRSKTEGMVFCSVSDDDTGNNQHNPIYWLNKAGAQGQLNQLAGTQQSPSGGNSQAPIASINPSIAPVRLQSNQDAINLVNLGTTISSFNDQKVKRILNTMSMTSDRKIASISRRSLPDQIKTLLGCGIAGTNDQISKFTSTSLSPDQDRDVTTAFAAVTNTGLRNRSAPIAKLALDGMIGVGTITLGGYDYHSGERSQGEARDEELGQIIGSIMQLASLKKKNVMIYVFTDGGVAANTTIDNSAGGRGKLGWGGDSGNRSSTFMLVYRDAGKVSVSGNRQMGYFRANGSVEANAVLTSNSVVNTSKALVANYLALHGKEGQLESVVGDNPFINEGLSKYLVFNKSF